jgi:hypothetical protein
MTSPTAVQPADVIITQHHMPKLLHLTTLVALDGDSAVWRNPISGLAERLPAGSFSVLEVLEAVT